MTFTELVNTAERKRWCTRPFCITCGAHKFRDHLRGIAKDDVISGLQLLFTLATGGKFWIKSLNSVAKAENKKIVNRRIKYYLRIQSLFIERICNPKKYIK